MGRGSEVRLHSFIPSSSHPTRIWVPALGTRRSRPSPRPCPALRAIGETDGEPLSEINVGTEEGQDVTGDTEVAPWPAPGFQSEATTARVAFTERRQANPTTPIPDSGQVGPPKEVSRPLGGRMGRTFQGKRTGHSGKLRTQRPSQGGGGRTDERRSRGTRRNPEWGRTRLQGHAFRRGTPHGVARPTASPTASP